MRFARSFFAVILLADVLVALDACGSRTGLDVPGTDDTGDASPKPADAGRDARDAGRDARDTGPDVVLPPIDANRPDVPPFNPCPDAGATLIYLISGDPAGVTAPQLMSFYPPTAQFTIIGTLVCPETPGNSTFSMAVDRRGKAYVEYTPDGRLFEVSTATAACTATTFRPNQNGFQNFGMGFAGLADGGESLYVAESPQGTQGTSTGLASIDISSFILGYIGPFSQPIERLELTGTGDGRLFGYAPSNTGSRIVQIDPLTANVVAANPIAVGTSQDAFAFAFWGGDFWIFTGSGVTSVYRYSLGGTTTYVTNAPALIVGAGVSTCAPQ